MDLRDDNSSIPKLLKYTVPSALLIHLGLTGLLALFYGTGYVARITLPVHFFFIALSIFIGFTVDNLFYEVGTEDWAITSGLFRYAFILAAIFIPDYVLQGALLVAYIEFVLELPVMIGGYWLTVKVVNDLM